MTENWQTISRESQKIDRDLAGNKMRLNSLQRST